MVLKEVRLVGDGDSDELAGDEPVSPTGQYFNSSMLSVAILSVFESDVPIDDSPTMSTLENLFLPINPRFSSIMVRDEHGVQHWKRVPVRLEEHISVPVFPSGLASYDGHVRDYITGIASSRLPSSRPPWAVHVIKYPSSGSEGTMVFKLHHALGDGYSLMGALFSCVQRADDPSLPLTFPVTSTRAKEKGGGWWWRVPRGLSVCVNTARDFGWGLVKSNFLADDRTPVRSGEAGVEFRPVTVSTVEFSLLEVRKIKAVLGGTINDVISGIVFYGTQLYMHAAAVDGKNPAGKVTALVLLNTRAISGYQSIKEMTKPDTKSPWGNQFGFMHVSVPASDDLDEADPLQFVVKAGQIIKAKRSSLAVYLTGQLLELLRKIRGPETSAKYLHESLRSTSMTVSNLTGPIEQMNIAGHPVRSMYFMVVGVPQSLSISVVSYMGKLTVAMGTEKGFINSDLLVSCMQKSYMRIFEAAVAKMA